MADIVDDFLTRLHSLLPNLPPDVPLHLEGALRQAWGGTEPYVGKRPSRVKSIKIGFSLRNRQPLSMTFAEMKVSRATGYRALRRK